MRVYRALPAAAATRVALTIGNFDGVHRGHQKMLSRLIEAADDLGLPPAVLTFEPHPREFFAPSAAPPRLATLRGKLEAFAAHGVAVAYVARFDARLASLAPEEFITAVLEQRLGARWVLVGEDFRFGRRRAGDLATLREKARGFTVEAMNTVLVGEERVSSTAVREALAAGELEHATALLGRPYRISGHVAHGAKLGRSLGFPTANIPLRHRPPLSGIYAVRVLGLPGAPRLGAASIGVRPTVTEDGHALLEVFILDFAGDIYGRRITVEFLHKLRDEERYPSLEALKHQIGLDVDNTRRFFAGR